MGTFVIKGRPTFLGKQNLGDFAHAIATDFGAEETDDTVLTDTAKSNAGGLFTFGFSMDCYYDAAVEELTIADIGNDVPLTFGSVDGTAQEIAYLINCREFVSSPFNASVGDMMGLNVSGNAADRLVRGVLEYNDTAITSANSTGIQQGLVSATQKIYANLHVISASAGDTLDVIVQSDNNGSFTSATNRITFTQISGGNASSEHLSLAGNIADDDYWRISFTIAGSDPSFTFAVSFGII